MKVEALRQWRKLQRRRQLLIAGACAALFLIVIGAALFFSPPRTSAVQPMGENSSTTIPVTPTVRLNLPPPDLLRPITPEEAIKENAEREFSGRPDTPATAFKLKADSVSRDRALECLTQAIYYEAATEGTDGQRAVAQIVLNRMRHPAYPPSVCGVVFQGAERPTGCQFTFTCDGSLARIPVQSLWKQARRIATESLSGKVFAPVGHATHYHADYVLPYWADSLDKSIQIGRHIFYRLKRGLGAKSAFRQGYSGVEPTPPPPTAVAVSLEVVENSGSLLPTTDANPLQVSAGELIASSEPKPVLVADALRGTLVIDGVTPPTPVARAEQTGDCGSHEGANRLRPLGANDVRAGLDKEGC